ncbi:hypothetical protein DDT54_07465 [Brenneria nigrifluens DSM 30175 = ATCC 13028]|uniref:Uncharacterized protein n=1 Tax=Brenneria nigrifluens DSM 30175 = ATCC 13028 TaxID=1121120 RepID=A0A2U1USW8_9GAMM|nr:hypothetical protein DDT54_07465 [Brenneria nigrifluens DSM 30175 = ATCC 13028]
MQHINNAQVDQTMYAEYVKFSLEKHEYTFAEKYISQKQTRLCRGNSTMRRRLSATMWKYFYPKLYQRIFTSIKET